MKETIIEVPEMMHDQNILWFSSSDALQIDVIELPFIGEEFVAIIVLPRPSQTLNSTFVDYLRIKNSLPVQELVRSARKIGVDYKIPKFQSHITNIFLLMKMVFKLSV